MKHLIALSVILAALAAAAAPAALAKPIDIAPASWTWQSQQPDDGKATVGDGVFTLTRGAGGGNAYMLRVFKDVPVTPGGIYVFSYAVRVEGEGHSVGILFNGDAQGKWDEKGAHYTDHKTKCDFTPVKTILVAPQGTVKLRLDLRAAGANTTVTYRDVALEEVGVQPDLVLTPSPAAVTLDGKLDDPLWADAVKLSPFRVLGDAVRPSAVANEALVALKDGDLWVGYRLSEPNTAGMKMRKPEDSARRLAPIGIYADDSTETFLSTDQVAFAHVIVNAAGARHWDQQNIGKTSPTWYPTTKAGYAGEWDARAAVGKGEWTCELRVKLSDLFGEAVGGDRKLYANFTRHRAQGEEENLTWAPISGQFYAVPKQFVPITLKLPAAAAPAAKSGIPGVFTRRLSVPDILMAGTPVKLAKAAGTFRLCGGAITEEEVTLDPGVKATLAEALGAGSGPKAQVRLQVKDVSSDPGLTARQRAQLRSPEAFRLTLAPGKAAITGRTRDGVLRGIATLILMANRARATRDAALPALTLYDAPRLPFRGLMVELNRRIVDVAFLLRMNKLLVYLDSFGGPTLFPFESYPIGGKKKTTKQELVDLFNYARARGIEPIPYFASWGRTQYLKVMPGGVDLLVDDQDVLQNSYRNLDVANPATHKVMLALQEEIIDTLHPQSFCIAMDEAHFGHMVTSAAARAKGWKPSDWFAEALNVNAAFFRKKGVRMFIWGDMIEPTHNGPNMDVYGPELLKRLPKDMTILDWEYSGRREVTEDYPSIAMFRDAGLPTIGCPWFAPKSIPRLARSIAQHGGSGLLLTAWNSSSPEAMPTEWIRACALTAYYGWSPEDCDPAHLSFVPDALMQGAAYWQRSLPPTGTVRSLAASERLAGGDELVTMLGLPAGTDTAFLAAPFRNYRGVGVKPFTRDGKPAAIALTGKDFAVVKNGDFADGLAGWASDSSGEDTLFAAEGGTLKATRVSGDSFRRVYQDLRLDAGKEYVVRYRAKVEGTGTARVWTYSGDEKFRWVEAKSIYSSTGNRDWATNEIALPPGFASLRICLSVYGPGTTAWFDEVTVIEKGATAEQAAPQKAAIPVNATARVITFWHATSRQVLMDEDMHANATQFASIIPGEYVVTYTDGTSEVIPLTYRLNIAAANDPTLGRQSDVGLFGTVGGAVFVNLPTYTWLNPHPEKPIGTIEARAGNSKEMTLLVLGMALD